MGKKQGYPKLKFQFPFEGKTESSYVMSEIDCGRQARWAFSWTTFPSLPHS